MPSREYSDSEEDVPVSKPSSSTHSPKAGPRVKLTLRPNLTHLMNDDPPPRVDPLPPVDTAARSSLSPPPPLTIRLGPRPPVASSPRKGRQAHYSDTSDEEAAPPKKLKLTTGKKATSQSGSSQGLSVKEEAGAAPLKRSYDWLQPSAAGASHQGPPERAAASSSGPLLPLGAGSSAAAPKISGWAPGEEYVSQIAGEVEPRPAKKSGKKEKVPGPGKAWRKGVKNGMVRPTSNASTPTAEGYLPSISASHPSYPPRSFTPGDITPYSRNGSPEMDVYAPLPPRAASPPFIEADAAKLGIPVFKQPIAPPKYNLTLFPKVSPMFAPLNGGDVGPFPRKEAVRRWKMSEKTFVGIGGSALKYKTWTRGPPSELGRLVKADKEAREILGVTAKEPVKKKVANTVTAPPTGTSTPVVVERPPLHSVLSTESTPTVSAMDVPMEDNASEVGDGEESVVSLKEGVVPTVPSPAVPAPKKKAPAKPKAKAGPRKSKLAQEIHPMPESVSATSAIEDLL